MFVCVCGVWCVCVVACVRVCMCAVCIKSLLSKYLHLKNVQALIFVTKILTFKECTSAYDLCGLGSLSRPYHYIKTMLPSPVSGVLLSCVRDLV